LARVKLKGRKSRRDKRVIRFLKRRVGQVKSIKELFTEYREKWSDFLSPQGFSLYLKRFRFKTDKAGRLILEAKKLQEGIDRITWWRGNEVAQKTAQKKRGTD